MLTSEGIIQIAKRATSHNGYAIYADYADDLREEICKGELSPRAGFYLFTIKSTLKDAGWRCKEGRPTRFYPPVS
jgi:hypothetical protein